MAETTFTELVYDEWGHTATIVTVDNGDGTGTRTVTVVPREEQVIVQELSGLPIVEDEFP